MAVPPRLPNLDPKDMQWVRWVTEKVQNTETSQSLIKSKVAAAAQQAATVQAAHATLVENTAASNAVNPQLPIGPPQTPSTPTLSTDHGTVTIRWDGQVHATLSYTPQVGDDPGSLTDPAIGFKHVTASRALSMGGPWTSVGGSMGHEGSIVDTNVNVGTRYYYQLITTDTLGNTSTPSAASSIVVAGVDLGTLNSDVTDAINAAEAAGIAGQNAAATAQTAANSAASQAATALANASTAQTAANTANAAAISAAGLAAGKSTVVYSNSAPTGDATVLWINTTGGANTPNRWNGSAWVVITDKAATDAAAAAATANTAAANAQTTANTAVANAATAQGTANTALTAANGKNKVIYSTSTASGTSGYINGDIWFQHDVSNIIIAQWQFDGSAWVSQTVSGTLVAAGINAGNITAGSISSARIAAGTISASQMIAGTITAASGVLADAVITTAKIADLAVSNAKIADLDANKIQAGTIVAGKLAAGSVTTNNIVAGAIDTNRLAAGAITADKISLGVNVPVGSTTDRVPQPFSNNTFWASVIAGTTLINSAGGNAGFSATTGGIVMPTTGGTTTTALFVTATLAVPPSNKVALNSTGNFTGTTGSGHVVIRWLNSSGTAVGYSIQETPGTTTYTALAGAVKYDVFLEVKPTGTGGGTVSALRVFEIIGTSEINGQAAQLSPAGLQLFDTNGQLAIDMTTNAAQYLSIVDNTGSEPSTVAAIDQFGNAAFSEVSTDTGFDINGILLTDLNDVESLINANPNGSTWSSFIPLFDRLGRGVIYDVTWDSIDDIVVASTFASFRIAQDSFILENGRQYMIHLQSGGLQMDSRASGDPAGASGVFNANMYLELQLSATPITNITTGTNISRGVVQGNSAGAFITQSPVFTASSSVSTIAGNTTMNNRLLPAGIPIYWQLDLSASSASRSWKANEFGYARGLSVIDIGSANINRPNTGTDSLANVSNQVKIASGGSATAGSGSTGTTATSKTVTFTANSSRTWNSSGSTIVTGTGQYDNGAAMYYGTGNTPMGSWFGNFKDSGGHTLNSVVGGKTITAAVLTVRNTYTYMNSGATVQFGTASTTTAPATIGTPASNVWSTTFAKGGTQSINLNSTVRGALSSGGVNSFVLGVSSSISNYSYFHGASQSYPPTLKVTYH